MKKINGTAKKSIDNILQWYWILLILAAPFLLFPTPIGSIFMLLIPLEWVMTWIVKGKPIPKTPLNSIILLTMLMVLTSLYATYDINVSLPKISGMVLGVGLFFNIVSRSRRRPDVWWGSLLIFVLTGLAVALLGLFGARWITKLGFLTPIISLLPARLSGLTGAENGIHPNEVAGALLWVIPLMLTLSYGFLSDCRAMRETSKNRISKVVSFFMLTSTTALLLVFILMQSRGGYIALVATSWILFTVILQRRWRHKFVVGSVVITITMLVAFLQISKADLEWNTSVSQLLFSPATSLDTLQGRVEIWVHAIYGIQDFPFTGMGMNTFRKIVHIFYPLLNISPNFELGHAHNEFLQAALDLGLPGLIAFTALYIAAFWMLKKCWLVIARYKYKSNTLTCRFIALSPDTQMKMITLGLGGGLFAHGIYSFTDAVSLGAKPGILFWMLLALITGYFLQLHTQNR